MKNIIPIPALADNYIWMFFDEALKAAWIVDPGEATPVINTLNQYGLRLAGILITHHHADHCGGIAALLHHMGNIPVFGSYKSPNSFISHPLKEGDEIILTAKPDVLQFNAIEIPGHTLDHTAYYGSGGLFCGDTLFSAGCGKVFEGTPAMMYHSLGKLKQLDDETKIYCGHEYTLANLQFAKQVEPNNPDIVNKIKSAENLLQKNGCTLPSTLQEEKTFNPFLRCDVKEVIDAAEKHAGKKLNDPVEVFATLREWKNNL